ncbi:MraY family glycosyltransferase [Nocardioides terrigena]|uniref:MraY family glycosyltransferase n=1 Tax=Nocardioides terrigena TaxID=424797 RepID=UPI000D318F37|nr:glycosyltransferase family 4 protein [Nocardioides terrigena]
MVAFSVALAAALLLTGLIVPFLRRGQLLDVPNERSSHSVPVPRGGGLAVMAAVALASTAAALTGREVLWVPLILALALAAVGLADDRMPLPGAVRLVLQLIAGVGVAVWAVSTASPAPAVGLFALVTVVAVAGYVNAFNFMDGINGISALTAVVAGAWWCWIGVENDLDGLVTLGAVVAGSMLGFAPWNAPHARVFLGDVGSYGVGFLVVTGGVWAWANDVSAVLCLAPLAVYIADTGWVLVKRAAGRRPLMQAHREHVYQQLVDGGWSHTASASLCAAVSLVVCCAIALAPLTVSLPAVAALLLAYLVAPHLARTGAVA